MFQEQIWIWGLDVYKAIVRAMEIIGSSDGVQKELLPLLQQKGGNAEAPTWIVSSGF